MSLSEDAPSAGEIWHPWWVLEEFKSSMWGSVKNRADWLQKAVEFTGNAELYGSWMLKVVDEWPLSCEHNLSKSGDKRAWIGHAAVALAIGCPEDIVRQAWPLLTDTQRTEANDKARIAIETWKERHAKKTTSV
jgi:hypothetical protein